MLTAEDSLALAEKVVRSIVAEHHDRPSLVSDIAVKIGAEIVEGRRAPGSDLNSVDLARRFKTSRTPIREALMLLEKQGLVTIPPRRRPVVFDLDIDQMREIYRVRGCLLELVAVDIAERAATAHFENLRHALARMESSRADARAYLWNNVAFYDEMTTLAGNVLAKAIIDSLLLRTLPMRRLSLSQAGRIARSLDDHMRLIRAFEDRDANLAAAVVRSNHRTALAALEAQFISLKGANI